ncbi:MAG: DNA-processing protein DprA [Planctomycetota bacterium]
MVPDVSSEAGSLARGASLRAALRSLLTDRRCVEEELDLCRRRGIRIILPSESEFPGCLRRLPLSPPLLYLRGKAFPPRLGVAVVGSRRASPLGMRQAYRLGRELTELGLTVVSGLARGIDSAALEGAVAGGGTPGAVLGNGLPEIYPASNEGLAGRIIDAGGFIISEFPCHTPPLRQNFPRRNRLISGLTLGVVVVEGSLRSGSMITAGWALDQGREVMAFPGPVEGPNYEGCHQLIRDGAALVACAEDVVFTLGGMGRREESSADNRRGEAAAADVRPRASAGGPEGARRSNFPF